VRSQFVGDSTGGRVEIEFGVNRWVMVTVGSEEGQEQIVSKRKLASYLEQRGLYPNEAADLAENAWRARPGDAAGHVAARPPNWTLLGATSWFDTMFVGAVVAALALLLIYLVGR